MTAIDEKLKQLREQEEKLREQERKLKLEQKKIDFLNHISASVVSYNDAEFAEVKEDVCLIVNALVDSAIKSIETGLSVVAETKAAEPQKTEPKQQDQKSVAKPIELSPNEKMKFALDNRHLAGKKVSIINDKNVDINGEVVGLDAPLVIVKTSTGPIIRVPLENVSLQ